MDTKRGSATALAQQLEASHVDPRQYYWTFDSNGNPVAVPKEALNEPKKYGKYLAHLASVGVRGVMQGDTVEAFDAPSAEDSTVDSRPTLSDLERTELEHISKRREQLRRDGKDVLYDRKLDDPDL